MSKKVITVELRHEGKELETIDLTPDLGEILIGRADTCKLQIPKSDAAASREHAKISFKDGSFWLSDNGSRNGISKDGKRVPKPVKLKDGDIYMIGTCLLVVSAARSSSSSGAKRRYDRLRFLDGERRGEEVEIRPNGEATGGVFSIGSDPANDLVLSDKSVSRRHVSIKVSRNGCYIQDLGSRNGTSVNGEKVSSRERFLKHRDRIQVAYYNLMFVDHTMPDPKPVISVRSICLLMVMAIVAGTGWLIWYLSQPSAAQWRKVAERMAAQENYAGAFAAVEKAYSARSSGPNDRSLTDSLNNQLKEWRDTDAAWTEVKRWLSEGSLGENTLQTLVSIHPVLEPDYGNWNPSVAAKHREADFTYRILRRLYDNAELKKVNPVNRSRLAAAIEDLDRYVASNKTAFASLPYVSALTNVLLRQQKELKEIRQSVKQMDGALEKISAGSSLGVDNNSAAREKTSVQKMPDFSGAIRILEELLRNPKLNAGVRAEAEALLVICRQFLGTQEFLVQELNLLTEMEFERLYSGREKLPLPDNDSCARHPAFSSARDAFKALHEAYQRESNVLAPMVRNLADGGVEGGRPGELVSRICDGKVWDKALSFDCFAGRFPVPSREEPNSVYDEFFGIETAYENMRALEKAPSRSNRLERNFVPKAIKAFLVFDQVRTFRSVLDREDAKAYRVGKLGEFYTLANRIMEMRDELVAMLKARQAKGSNGVDLNRTQIVAGLFAEYFSDKGEESYANLRALASAFKRLEAQVNALDEKLQHEPDPEKRLKLRKEIIATGLPGGEVVRKHWVDMVDGRQ